MLRRFAACISILFFLCASPILQAQATDWGAPPITVAHQGNVWTITGSKNTVTLDAVTLAVTIRASGTDWKMVSSSTRDLQVRTAGRDRWLRLADATVKQVLPYKTGFKTGVKITLANFRGA